MTHVRSEHAEKLCSTLPWQHTRYICELLLVGVVITRGGICCVCYYDHFSPVERISLIVPHILADSPLRHILLSIQRR